MIYWRQTSVFFKCKRNHFNTILGCNELRRQQLLLFFCEVKQNRWWDTCSKLKFDVYFLHKLKYSVKGNFFVRGSAIAKILGKNVVERKEKFNPEVKMYMYEEMIDGRKLTEIVNTEHENVKYLPGIKLPENVVCWTICGVVTACLTWTVCEVDICIFDPSNNIRNVSLKFVCLISPSHSGNKRGILFLFWLSSPDYR